MVDEERDKRRGPAPGRGARFPGAHVRALAEALGITRQALYRRLARGWSPAQASTEPRGATVRAPARRCVWCGRCGATGTDETGAPACADACRGPAPKGDHEP